MTGAWPHTGEAPQPPADERDNRVAWIKDQQRAGRFPSVDLYFCACGLWTIAVYQTPNVRCSCGEAPVYRVTVVADAASVETKAAQGDTP